MASRRTVVETPTRVQYALAKPSAKRLFPWPVLSHIEAETPQQARLIHSERQREHENHANTLARAVSENARLPEDQARARLQDALHALLYHPDLYPPQPTDEDIASWNAGVPEPPRRPVNVNPAYLAHLLGVPRDYATENALAHFARETSRLLNARNALLAKPWPDGNARLLDFYTRHARKILGYGDAPTRTKNAIDAFLRHRRALLYYHGLNRAAIQEFAKTGRRSAYRGRVYDNLAGMTHPARPNPARVLGRPYRAFRDEVKKLFAQFQASERLRAERENAPWP